ncbi:MAG: histidine phosphatase family protein [Alphaproteobacteria bacterium]|jgi:alpha-ribazole phosphatase|nr:histidine phosphatase family protein [Alphaproteobacteria bacterium]MBT7944339.1 histidine phosphatase family protein [Alphaproteobacteria bacterium]
MSSCTRWWWVRHAPVVGVEGVIYGSNDVECDVSNRADFDVLAKTLPKDAVWVTSHLSRAIKTARTIAEAGLDMPDPLIEEHLAEQNFGDWQGLSWDTMRETDPEGYATFWGDPTRNRPPGGESFADVIDRTGGVIERLNAEHEGRDIVCVVHGGTIRAALSVALGLSPVQGMSIRVDTLSLSVTEHLCEGLLQGRGGEWRVVGVNRLAG